MNHFTLMFLGKNPPAVQVTDTDCPIPALWLGPDTTGGVGWAAGRNVGPSDRALTPPPGPGAAGIWGVPGGHGCARGQPMGSSPGIGPRAPSPALLAPSRAHGLGWFPPGAALGAPLTVHGHLCALSALRHLFTTQPFPEPHAVIGAGILRANIPDLDAVVRGGSSLYPDHAGVVDLLIKDGLVPTAPALQPPHSTSRTTSG